MLCARPGGEVVAALGDQFEREVWAEAVDLRQVLAVAGLCRPGPREMAARKASGKRHPGRCRFVRSSPRRASST